MLQYRDWLGSLLFFLYCITVKVERSRLLNPERQIYLSLTDILTLPCTPAKKPYEPPSFTTFLIAVHFQFLFLMLSILLQLLIRTANKFILKRHKGKKWNHNWIDSPEIWETWMNSNEPNSSSAINWSRFNLWLDHLKVNDSNFYQSQLYLDLHVCILKCQDAKLYMLIYLCITS